MYFVPRERWVLGIVVLFLAGFFAYGAQSAFWALAPDLLGRHRTGTGIGVMNFFAYLVAGVSEPFIGWMIQRSGYNYGLVFPIVGSFCIAAGIGGLFIKR
jgi:OPA family glycerol-3-phosphate transporter-like MFS transporter